MRTDRSSIMKILLFAVIAVFLAGVIDTYARGRGHGGGGHSRSANRNISRQGPARTGSMKSSDFNRQSRSSSSRNVQRSQADRQPNRQAKAQDYKANHPDKVKDFQDKRADNGKDFQEDRQDWKDQNREDWQKYGRNAREDRQDTYDNHYYHDHYDHWEWGDNVEYPYAAATAIALGTALTVSAFNSLTCNPTIVSVGGVTYYQCGTNWYNQAYQQGDVVYISVVAPSGY